MADMRTKDNKDLHTRLLKRHKLMVDADRDNRGEAMEDMEFTNVPGAQWQKNMKQERGDRPCYEYNKVRIRCKRVVNDMRDNRPSGKIRAVEGGDKEGAELREGLIRNIWNMSHGDDATDYAAEYQVEGGMGAWRVDTQYADDSAFDQDIVIEPVQNPFCLYCDPAAKDFMKRDAEDWVFTERISHKEYEAKYGEKAEKIDFDGDDEFDSDEEWYDDETVRVAEYWYKVPHEKDLWMVEVPDPEGQPDEEGNPATKTLVVDSESDEAAALAKDGIKPKQVRTVKTHKIMMCVANGRRILEGPVEWAGHKFPWVMVFGEFKVIDGKKYWWGLTRFARDAQRSYNIAKTAIAETIHQAPKAKWWATPKQAEGLTDSWSEAHKKNYPYMIYNPDPEANGPPQRMGGADVPVALMQQADIDNEDLKDVMGLPDSSMGHEGDEKSGRAIYARKQQGDVLTFNFKDNMAKAVQYTHELLLDLIPEVYDSERELRILGEDGREDYKRVNQLVYDPDTKKTIRVNDLAAGKYDVAITVGPAFSTQRQEAAEVYSAINDKDGQLMTVAGDLIFKSLDLPYAEEIAERLRAMLPQQIQSMLDKDTELPPEVQQAMQRVEAMMAEAQKYGQLVQEAAAELEQEKSVNAQAKADIKVELANLRAAKAEFDADMAKQAADLIKEAAGLEKRDASLSVKDAEIARKEAQNRIDSAMIDLGDLEIDPVKYKELIENVEKIDRMDVTFARFMQAADQVMARLEGKTDRTLSGGTISRKGGTLTAVGEYSDGSSRKVSAVRDGPNLKIVPEVDAEP